MVAERVRTGYGDGVLFGDRGDDFFASDHVEQAKQLGASVACPVVPRLIEARGAVAMAKRYGELLSWTGVIGEMLEKRGYSDIKYELTSAVRRETDEPWGELRDDEWVPAELEHYMFGPASPEGYGLPRMITSFLGKHSETWDVTGAEERTSRAMEVLDLVDEAIDRVDESTYVEDDERLMSGGLGYELTEFSVIVADLLVRAGEKYGIPAGEFFHQLVGTGKLKEDNCRRRYRSIVGVMHDIAPDLYEKYMNLNTEEIEEHHVAVSGVDF